MKKLLFTTFAGIPQSNTGGPNKVIYDLIQNINFAEIEVHFLSKNGFFEIGKENLNLKEKVIKSKFNFTKYLFNNYSFYRKTVTNPYYVKYYFYKAFKHFDSFKNYNNYFDIIHSHDSISLYPFLETPSKKIITIHSKGSLVEDLIDYFGDSPLLKTLYKKINILEEKSLEKADFITFPSQAAKDLYLSKINISDNQKIRVIYNGIDLTRINNISPNEEYLIKNKIINDYDIKILNVADHIKAKNINLIIEVIRILKYEFNKNPLFVNIGNGPETENLNILVKKYQLINNVKFLGKLTNQEVIGLMKLFEYFLILSDRVIFDMVILEALASGMTVIASNSGGNREIINNGKNGFLVSNKDLTESIKIITNNIKCDKNEIYNSIKRFEINNITKQYIELYNN